MADLLVLSEDFAILICLAIASRRTKASFLSSISALVVNSPRETSRILAQTSSISFSVTAGIARF